MPTLIAIGIVNQNTPQENAGLFLGEGNIGGWDANMKINQGAGSPFGFFNIAPGWLNLNIDNLELVDGVINDQDIKPTGATQA